MDPEEIVNQAEAAYQSQDLDRIMELFDPEIVVYWNGWKKAEGLEGVRKAYEERSTDEGYEEYQIEKTLRAASGETITVEWKSTRTYADGSRQVSHGGEFWTMRDDRILEWHAYCVRHDEEDELISPHPWDGPETY